MARLIPVAMVLLGILVLGLGVYALIFGQINLLRSSIRGAEARLIGLVLIISALTCLPLLARGLVGLGMNLGH